MIIKKLEELRKEANLTQLELATAVGKSREWYSKVLQKGDIKLTDVYRICDVLKCTPEYLVSKETRQKWGETEGTPTEKEKALQEEMLGLMRSLIETQKQEIANLKQKLKEKLK